LSKIDKKPHSSFWSLEGKWQRLSINITTIAQPCVGSVNAKIAPGSVASVVMEIILTKKQFSRLMSDFYKKKNDYNAKSEFKNIFFLSLINLLS